MTGTRPPRFEVVKESLLRALAEHGRITTFNKREMLIREGERGETLFILLRGRVKVFSANNEGKELILDTLGPGDTLGEMTLDAGVRSASVEALEATTCSVVTADEMRRYITANPEFALQLITHLIGRTRIAVENLKRMAPLNVHGRLTTLLTSLTPKQQGTGYITEKLSQQQLAERVGASRDMVSRILHDLAAEGYVAIHSKQIDVLKPLPKP
ncbi:MAG: Crp/Fnr family transcriptional regulator [Aeromicrobium sp.]|nr:Crp/Fnr family transcriptional regulator [Burkholderiales bacterium]